MVRRHHTLDLQNHQFNGTMRVAVRVPSVSLAEVEMMKRSQREVTTKYDLAPENECFGRIREMVGNQFHERGTFLGKNLDTHRKGTIEMKSDWRPMEVSPKDSKSTKEMIDFMDQLLEEGSVEAQTM